MTLYDYLEECYDNDKITNILIELDYWLERLHNHGFCIYDFNPKKIKLEDSHLTFNSFLDIINDIGISTNAREINIFQENKIGLMAYNKIPVDGNMNQAHFNFLQENLEKFNQNGNIPEEVYEYYEEVFRRLNVTYLNDYLVKKQQDKMGNQNANVRRKTLSTSIGRAYANEDAAFVNILLLPSIIAFIYLMGLFIYTFILK